MRLAEQYNALSFDDVHASWLQYLPEEKGLALDVGAGSGRDARALASAGWTVWAIEPAEEMRNIGKEYTDGLAVEWISDKLPNLGKVQRLEQHYQLILVSAVWMHLNEQERAQSFVSLSEMLAPGGLMVISLRHGPDSEGRNFFQVSADDLEAQARLRGFRCLPTSRANDAYSREGVWWEVVVLQRGEG